jgi:hypothetical protein
MRFQKNAKVSIRKEVNLGVDEFKPTKIDVKTSTFLQFLLHLFIWCHFNGMGIMESCAY